MRTRQSEPVHLLVVDGANVVGSRPDGWWRDRAGAARRLHARLVAFDRAPADPPGPRLAQRVVLVLEGKAVAGVPATAEGPVEVRHAAGSGDDAIVQVVREAGAGSTTGGATGSTEPARVTVVTADRGLRSRVEALGARTVGPGWLLEQLAVTDEPG